MAVESPWGDELIWTSAAGDGDWCNPANWEGYVPFPPIPPTPPDANNYCCVLPSQPGPRIGIGSCVNATAAMLSLNPWDPTSWGSQDTIVTITDTALDANFGAAIQINSQVDYDSYLGTSTLVSKAIVNVYGGTVTTPNPANTDTLCGIHIGGGSSNFGWAYGMLNIYGGLVSVPRVALYFGEIGLYGGTLRVNTDPNFTISSTHPGAALNKVRIDGGTLILAGDHRPDIVNFEAGGYILCDRGTLRDPVYDGSAWTTLAADVNYCVWNPQPANNATNVRYWTPDGNSITLSWQESTFNNIDANDDVYFGTSFADVNTATKATTGIYKGSRNDDNGDPCSFTIKDPNKFSLNTTYYWRVDENSVTDGFKKGLVWKFTTHDGKAYNPMPIDGATALSVPLQLSWTPGDWTQSTGGHRVFFGTSYTSILNASTGSSDGRYRGTATNPVYPLSRLLEKGPNPPGASWVLTPGTPYYWRVDEMNGVTQVGGKGTVWSFTPASYINIEDFEDYDSTAELTANWQSGYVVTGCGDPFITGNAGRALIRDATGKHLRYTYRNSGSGAMAFSETRRPYSGGTSFTGGGTLSAAPKALRIDYLGSAINAVNPVYDRMYVALEDTAGNVSVYDNPDGNAAQVSSWTSWYSSLYDINAAGTPGPVNLQAISGLAIGFGVRCDNYTFAGGDGNVMFDNIQLYAPMCVPQFGPKADLDGDCDVDINDLDIFVNDWLLKAEPIPFPVTPPSKAPILWYKFNETGSNSNPVDSGMGDANDYTGTVKNFIAQNWDVNGGRDGNNCLYLPPPYANCYVDVPVASLGFMGDANHTTPGGGGISFSVWINAETTASNMRTSWNGLFSVWNGAVNIETLVVHCPSPFPPTDPTGPGTVFMKTSPSATASVFNMHEGDYGGKWNHWAFTKSDYSMKIYCNGSLIGHCDANGQPGDPNANVYGPLFDPNVGAFRIGTSGVNWGMWNGRIDDFQVYDYCLSAEEIAYLASDGGFFPVIPLISPANFNTDGGLPTDANQIVNFNDFAILGQEWRTIVLWP
jgi:Concanavalin A-like lectin/glucanases superfamily